MQQIEMMPTTNKKRRVVYVDDQKWSLIEFLETRTHEPESVIVRRLLEHLNKEDRKELLKIIKSGEK